MEVGGRRPAGASVSVWDFGRHFGSGGGSARASAATQSRLPSGFVQVRRPNSHHPPHVTRSTYGRGEGGVQFGEELANTTQPPQGSRDVVLPRKLRAVFRKARVGTSFPIVRRTKRWFST